MKTQLAILRNYRRMRVSPVFQGCGQWFALSQYGYILGAFETRKDALRHALTYYGVNFQLITQ